MTEKFNEFREVYLRYKKKFTDNKLLLLMSVNDVPALKPQDNYPPAELTEELHMASQMVILLLNDEYINEGERQFFFKSVRKFVETEIKLWEEWDPNFDVYEFSNRKWRIWMPECLNDILNEIERLENEIKERGHVKPIDQRLIVIICHLKGINIEKGYKAERIALQYGHTSGDSIYKKHLELNKRLKENSESKTEKLIKDIEGVFIYLDENERKKARDLIRILKSRISF